MSAGLNNAITWTSRTQQRDGGINQRVGCLLFRLLKGRWKLLGKTILLSPMSILILITQGEILWAKPRQAVAFNDWLVSAPRKHYTTTTSLDCWHKAGWAHGFMLLMPNSDSTICCLSRNPHSSDQATFFQSLLVQFWCLCPPLTSVLGSQDRNLMWFRAVVVHPPEDWMFCALRYYWDHHSCKEWLSEVL